jgi:hypothetical protein
MVKYMNTVLRLVPRTGPPKTPCENAPKHNTTGATCAQVAILQGVVVLVKQHDENKQTLSRPPDLAPKPLYRPSSPESQLVKCRLLVLGVMLSALSVHLSGVVMVDSAPVTVFPRGREGGVLGFAWAPSRDPKGLPFGVLLLLIDVDLCREGVGVGVSRGDGVSTKVNECAGDESTTRTVECGIWSEKSGFDFARLELKG